MRKIAQLLLPCLTCFTGIAAAQGVQNMDIFWLFGPNKAKAQVVPGTSITVGNSWGSTMSIGYGYQIGRWSAASLWLELVPGTFVGNSSKASIPGSVDFGFSTYTAGLRFMVPLHPRFSVYAASGGGFGTFYHARILGPADNPSVDSDSNTHGVFDFGGGFDIRLKRFISIRAEVRDFVTGRNLSGIAGRNHLVPVFGVALHF